ncbi:MAG: helix-turn-helix domain-containing protein [Blastocatellia bacterium]
MPKFTGTKEQKVFQELLRDLRTESGFTQITLSQKLGRAQSYVSKYESGERRLDFLELRQLCSLFGVSVAEFSKRLDKFINES